MRTVRGLGLAFAFFALSFALHIVGGATDQDWLFAIAVALIILAAMGFPAFALAFGSGANSRERRLLLALGGVAGVTLTASALWAANDRATAAWHLPAALGLVLAVSGGLLLAGRLLGRWRLAAAPGRAAAGAAKR